MAFIVEMARGRPGEAGFETYSCRGATWKGLLAIGRSFGWQASGTVPDPLAAQRNQTYGDYFKPTYDPEEWGYCKQLTAQDAGALAAALRRAGKAISAGEVAVIERLGPTLLKDELSPEELKRVNTLPTEQMEAFAQFAEGGEFSFAWDD